MSSSPADRRSLRRDLVLLTVLLGVLFGLYLGSRALWEPDEGRYAEIPREMLATGNYVTPRINGVKYFEKPALFYWLQAGSFEAFGLNEWAARIPTALLALIGCLAVYGAGRRFFGRRAGWLAAGILATSPLYFVMARTITLDMAVSVLITLSMLAFLAGVREPPGRRRRNYLWAFYALAALATLTKGLIGIVIPGMVIFVWLLILNDWRLLRSIYLPSGIAIFLAIALPWHVMISLRNPEFLYYYFVEQHFLRYLTKISHRYQPPWFFIPVLLLTLYPWTIFLFQSLRDAWPRRWAERRGHRETLFLMLWAALVFAFFSFSDSKLIPYILPVFPPLALLMGRYLARGWERPGLPGIRGAFWVLPLFGLGLAAAFLILPHRLPQHPSVAESTALLGDRLYWVAGTIAAAGVIPFVLSRFRRFPWTIGSLLATTAAFLLAIALSMQALDVERSVKGLAQELRPLLKPGTEVMTYHTYYQDLPFYLRRTVTVVDWKGELRYGTTVENDSAWMIDDAVFWRRWQSPRTVYMITGLQDYEQLRAGGRGQFYLVARENDNVLLVNHEPKR